MNKDEIKKYIKDNLKLDIEEKHDWHTFGSSDDIKITLKLEDEIISEYTFRVREERD